MNKISDKLKIRRVRTQIVRLKENLQKPKVKTVLTVILLGGELFRLFGISLGFLVTQPEADCDRNQSDPQFRSRRPPAHEPKPLATL